MNNRVILGKDNFDLEEFREKMIYDDTDAVVTSIELARDKRKGIKLESVEIESYGSPTRNSMEKIKDVVRKRFDISNIVIIQRVGKFIPGENITGILISAPERGEALEALAMALDMFETHVPIKKRVTTVDGREYWIKRADEVMNLYGQVAEGI